MKPNLEEIDDATPEELDDLAERCSVMSDREIIRRAIYRGDSFEGVTI